MTPSFHFDGDLPTPLVLLLNFDLFHFPFLDFLPDLRVGDEPEVLLEFLVYVFYLLDLCQLHAVVPEAVLSPLADICDFLHGFDGVDVDVSVVHIGLVDLPLQLEDAVLHQLFIMQFSIGFGPLEFSRVVLGLEMFVAFGPAESEGLAIVPDEHHAMAGVDWPRAEVAFLDPHFNNAGS